MQLLDKQNSDEEHTVRGISDLAKRNLAEKLFGSLPIYSNCRLTYEMFFNKVQSEVEMFLSTQICELYYAGLLVIALNCMQQQVGRHGITFWKWFYQAAEMVEKFLLTQWQKG